MFEWYVVWGGSKNGHQKVKCLKEIGQHVHNIITILGALVTIIGRARTIIQ